jgi:PAS domain S-box-containing protein
MAAERQEEPGDRVPRADFARAESALRESEERFRSVVHGAPDGVAILRGPTILYLNPRGARMLGLAQPEDGYGRPITDFMVPEDQVLASQRIGDLVRTGKPADAPREYRSRSLDGRELSVEISSILIDFDGGKAVLAFARDVTERKALQTRLAQADRLAALGMLSAGVAHEINNPLAYVLLNLELLSRDIQKGGELDRHALLGRVQEARHGGERVATIVRDLKTFAREDQPVHWPVHVEAVLDAALNVVGTQIAERGRVVRNYGKLSLVEGIAARLEQVFVNLLTNAAQALPEGQRDRHEVTLSAREDPDFVYVSVRDTGVGMSEEIQRRIFDPFFTTKPAGVGTGLGLPICQGIVTAHGGSLDVVTAPGAGSTFTVKLRRFTGVVGELPPETVVPKSTRGRLLIVDDDMAVGRTLRLALQEDHDVIVVGSGADALTTLRAAGDGKRFDAILCDLLMPVMTGAELFAIVRSELPEAAQRFIFMSGGYWASSESSPTGSQPVLEKPFNLEQVRRVLLEVVGRSQSQKPPPAG